MTAPLLTPLEVVEQATALIAAHGLAHGSYQDADGRMCVAGAIRRVIFGRPYPGTQIFAQHPDGWDLYCRTTEELIIAINTPTGVPFGLVDWNDSTEEADVLAGLRAAAVLMRGEQVQA